ncbi:dymeclin [Cricetulus griseus]
MMLEIINSCLTNSLHHNPNLVYALLYKRDLFEQFRTHPSFQDIMQNIDLVISFFSSRLLQAGAELSVERVLEIIKQGVVALPKDRLKFRAWEQERKELGLQCSPVTRKPTQFLSVLPLNAQLLCEQDTKSFMSGPLKNILYPDCRTCLQYTTEVISGPRDAEVFQCMAEVVSGPPEMLKFVAAHRKSGVRQ